MIATLGTVHFLSGRGGWWDLGGAMRKKKAFEGGPSQKNKGKRRGHVKYFSKTLKWHNV